MFFSGMFETTGGVTRLTHTGTHANSDARLTQEGIQFGYQVQILRHGGAYSAYQCKTDILTIVAPKLAAYLVANV